MSIKKDGFGSDEGASLRYSFEGIINEMGEEGNHHINVADNIRKMVIQPFRKWTDEHKQRVDYSYGFLKSKVDTYNKDGTEAQKIQSKYFNKCRVFDIARREDEIEKMKLEANAEAQGTTHEHPPTTAEPVSNEAHIESTHTHTKSVDTGTTLNEEVATQDSDDDDYEDVFLGEIHYGKVDLKHFLSRMLGEISQKNVKISILGTYDHVSTGADIVDWLTKNSTSGSIAMAEKIGQDLIASGFLRLVGQVGNKFLNSSVQKYQWKRLAFIRAGLGHTIHEKKGAEIFSSMAGEYLPDSISSSITNYLNNPNPNETPLEKLEREVRELDKKCHEAVNKYDDSRMILEEMIFRHYEFMQRCESDRLKAIKVVVLDFTAAVSNKVASLKASIDKYLLYQESIVPERDLRYLIELYKTGPFAPKVPCYDNYYAPSKGWTYGGDLEVRARGDGKRIPLIVSTILRYLDNQYPSMQDDEKRLGIWTVKVPLEETHKLRRVLNTGEPIQKGVLDDFKPPIVVNALKLYLLELPDSLVPSKYYESLKNIYSERPVGSGAEAGSSQFTQDETERLKNVQYILQDCKVSCVMTIDAIAKHLERLMEIAKPEEEYKVELAQELGSLFFRPKQQNATTMSDKHPYLLARDFLEHRRAIFDDLRRQKSGTSTRKSSFGASQSTRSNRGSGVNIPSNPTRTEFVATYGENLGGLSRQSSFASESESKDFHTAPTPARRLAQTISSSNKRDSVEITAVNENAPRSPEVSHSARKNESLTNSSTIPNGAEVIEVDDD